MNRVDRLIAAINGERVDRPPFSFWYHFGLQHMPGEAVAAAHIAFAERFEPDFVKVMNDYPYPIRSLTSLDRYTDFLMLKPVHGTDGGWGHQLVALKQIVKAMKGETWVVDTIRSPWTILCDLSSPDLVQKTARQYPEIIKNALETVAKSLISYVYEALSCGIQGFYFTLSEANYGGLGPAEHQALCQSLNNQILEAAAEAQFNILHLDGNRLYFDGLTQYSTQAVSWDHFRTKPGIAKGLTTWHRAMLAGIDHNTLSQGTPASIREHFERYAAEYFLPGVIIAPGASLPTSISPYLLDAVRDGVQNLTSAGKILEKVSLERAAQQAGMDNNAADFRPNQRNYRSAGPESCESRRPVESRSTRWQNAPETSNNAEQQSASGNSTPEAAKVKPEGMSLITTDDEMQSTPATEPSQTVLAEDADYDACAPMDAPGMSADLDQEPMAEDDAQTAEHAPRGWSEELESSTTPSEYRQRFDRASAGNDNRDRNNRRGPGGPRRDDRRGPGGPRRDDYRGPGGPRRDDRRGPGGPRRDDYRGPGGPGREDRRGPGGPRRDDRRGPGEPGREDRRGPGGPRRDDRWAPGGPRRDDRRGPGGPGGPRRDDRRGPGGPGGPRRDDRRGPGGPRRDDGWAPGGPRRDDRRGPGGPRRDDRRGPGGPRRDDRRGPGGPRRDDGWAPGGPRRDDRRTPGGPQSPEPRRIRIPRK